MIKKLLKLLVLVTLAIPGLFERTQSKVESPAASSPAPKNLRKWLLIGGALLGVLGIGGFLVMVSGVVPIKASSGHWAITQWFLNFAKERSVATHTLGKKPPPLDAPWLAVKGAAHYETGCRSCHGSPGAPQPRVALRMTPTPPPLTNINSKFDASELFYIVKHGIKFTGMPAWPADQRDDEVWDMVAFLQALSGLDAEAYRRLANGEMPPPGNAPRAVAESCSRCHGPDGLGRGFGAFPKLAGQKQDYLLTALEAYASGKRSSGMMGPVAAGLTSETMRELADYYSNLRVERQPLETSDPAAIERGRAIARHGIPSLRVPPCLECHGPNPIPRNTAYPLLAGQYPEYLVLQLELFKTKTRGGTAYSHLMHFVAGGLTTGQMNDVAQFFASLEPEHGGQSPVPFPK